MKDIFTYIYNNNYWGGSESRSGTGSSIEQTKYLVKELKTLFNDFNICSILDIPCGDFHWMKESSALDNIQYSGGDIVDEIIDSNTELYSKENISFNVLDITKDTLPSCDLIMIRDCLVHFNFDKIEETFDNLKNQNYKYALITSFTERPNNVDLNQIGEWRPINLCKPPFSLSEPIKVINENCSEGNGIYSDKSMCLWKKEDLDSVTINKLASLNLNI